MFYTLSGIISIVISGGIFMFAWNSRHMFEADYLLFLGIAYLFVGALDLIHTLAYPGMGVLAGSSTNLGAQLWLSARYLESISLLFALLFLKGRLHRGFAVLAFGTATVLLLISVFKGVFPVCFTEGEGLTVFKKIKSDTFKPCDPKFIGDVGTYLFNDHVSG